MSGHHQTLRQIFQWPLVLGLLSLTGLVGALLTDGIWDWVFAAMIAGSLGAVAWARLRPSRR